MLLCAHDKVAEGCLYGLVTYCMFRGGFEDHVHGVERHNQNQQHTKSICGRISLSNLVSPLQSTLLGWAMERKILARFLNVYGGKVSS